MPRAFIRQTIDLGGDAQKVPRPIRINSEARSTTNRLVVTIGKFAPTDMFDKNKYAHHPRQRLHELGADRHRNVRLRRRRLGLTYGGAAEWYQGDWTVRGGLFDQSIVPNSTDLDASFGQFQWIGEVERRWELWSHPGKIAFTGFLTRARLGSYQRRHPICAACRRTGQYHCSGTAIPQPRRRQHER